MKLKFLQVLAMLAVSFGAFGQASLPTSWDFNGTAPTGWTQSGTVTYSSSALVVVAPSAKLDNTADNVAIYVADAPGRVVYYIGGATANSAPWSGTFSVQESVNGTVWTDLKVYTNNLTVSGGLVKDSVLSNSASRYIRFYFTNKVSGSNVALDNVSIAEAPPSPVQEINVEYNGQPAPNGSTIYITSPVGTGTSFNLDVENAGTANQLTVSLPSFSGPQQTDFIVNTYPATVNAGSTDAVTFTFTPPVAGTRLAQISIPNNDLNENPYIINIYATGGNFATEPTAQATGLTFPTNKTFRVKGQFSAASPAADGGYLVLRKNGSTVTELPVDGQVYSVGDYIGAAQVIAVGQGTTFQPRNIVANTAYHFAVFSYNGVGANTNYLTTSPLAGTVTTPLNAIGNYYAGVDKSNPNFVATLTAKINPHDQVFYGNYDEVMVNLFQARDTTNGQKVITCGYTGEEYIYDNPFTWDIYSREHTYCHAWMPSNPADAPTERPEYDDMHHLYPVNFAQANNPRSDNPLGEVVTTLQSYLDGKLGYNANNQLVYEPRDEHKGRAARAIMYMPTCYNGDGFTWNVPGQQDINTLKQWHFQFPPDEWDMARNDFIDSVQGNRNPFVDSTDFVCYINFTNMTYVNAPTSAPCLLIGVNENKAPEFSVSVYPVPSNGAFSVSVMAEKTQAADVLVTDYTGRVVMQKRINVVKGANLYEIDLGAFDSGIYNLSIRSDVSATTKRLVVVH